MDDNPHDLVGLWGEGLPLERWMVPILEDYNRRLVDSMIEGMDQFMAEQGWTDG